MLRRRRRPGQLLARSLSHVHVEVARLFNYLTAKRSRLLNINGGYYIYIIGVTIAGHTYDGREEITVRF